MELEGSERERRQDVEERTRWFGGEQVPDVAGSAGGGDGELRRQYGGEEPLHHIGERDQRAFEPSPLGLRWRHGDGHREEGETRSEEEGFASCHCSPAQAMAPKGRRLHVFRRYTHTYPTPFAI